VVILRFGKTRPVQVQVSRLRRARWLLDGGLIRWFGFGEYADVQRRADDWAMRKLRALPGPTRDSVPGPVVND
jgi:hypothetical protein